MEEDKLYKSLEFIKPTKSFANDERPKAPDYSNMHNWAAYPEKNGHQFLTPDPVSLYTSDAADE